MSDITDPKTGAVVVQNNPTPLHAKYFSVVSPDEDRYQFEKAVEAFRQAGMPFSIIANVGEEKGYDVKRGEVDANFFQNPENLASQSGLEQKEDALIAFQKRGEVVSNQDHLLASSEQSASLVPISQALTTPQADKIIEVIEGIAILKDEQLAIDQTVVDTASLKS
jgi:hypothetical protein